MNLNSDGYVHRVLRRQQHDPRFAIHVPMKWILLTALLTITAACGGTTLTSPDANYRFDAVEGSPAMHRFQITNGGESNGPIRVSLVGAQEQFKIVGDTCSQRALEPYASCLVTVQLSSDSAGTFTAQLRFDATPASLVINMSGQVTPGRVVATLPSPPVHVLQGASALANVTLTNGGGARTQRLLVTAPGNAIANDHCSGSALAGGASCTFAVGYGAGSDETGTPTARVEIDGDPAGPIIIPVPFTIDLLSTLQISGDLGIQDPARPLATTFTITNLGPTATGPLSFSLAGGDESSGQSSPFRLDGDPDCTSLAVQSICYLTLTIDPTLPAPRSYTSSLIVSATGARPATAMLNVATATGSILVELYRSGTGSGAITRSNSAGDSCRSTGPFCRDIPVATGSTMTFTAVPDKNSVFAGWDKGPCSGSTNPACTVSAADAASGRVTVEAVINAK
jgi:hypothetical protein